MIYKILVYVFIISFTLRCGFAPIRNESNLTLTIKEKTREFTTYAVSSPKGESLAGIKLDSDGNVVQFIKPVRDTLQQVMSFNTQTGRIASVGRYKHGHIMDGEWIFYHDNNEPSIKARYMYFNGHPSGYVTLYHDYYGSVSDTIFYDQKGERRWRQSYPEQR